MQDKSINNALLALRKTMIQGNLDGLGHVEALIALRGVELPRVMVRCAPIAKRGAMRRMVLDALRDGPMTRRQLVERIAVLRPDVPTKRLYWRVDAAMSKLRSSGVVARDGSLWKLAQ